MSKIEIFEKHQSNGKKVCYAPTLGPVTALHQFSNSIEAKVLRCTLPLDHKGDHRDGACCYSAHIFNNSMAGPPEPEHLNWEQCVECKRSWPCDVERLRLLNVEKETGYPAADVSDVPFLGSIHGGLRP